LVIHVRAKNAEMDGELHDYAQAQLQGLGRFSSNNLISASVAFTGKVSRNLDRANRAEVVVFAPGHSFHAEENANSFEAALDAALDKLKQQLKKLKEKRDGKARHQPGLAEIVNTTAAMVEAEAAETEAQPQVLLEEFTVKPMDVREAVMQLDKAFRDFYVFYNHQNQVQCVYKRPDGNIGLLVPETELQ
jgi:putative sigma-54 modulation protein